ncbi:hypothetical protein ACUN7V_02430 [Quadrisphaera oryzae]|uniref:hypothetical protein n=1 Tax=Quadrisphaera TaxID=317661 RepID=UPI001645C69C|nr:hypothetical protein [Quadrisphaera sp. RL12-1S]MBC3761075.1 hypothetical protein [Quadrisphaera sp. RL12-1S]
MFALAAAEAPTTWPYEYVRVDRQAFYTSVINLVSPLLSKPASLHDVLTALRVLEREGVVTTVSAHGGSGTHLRVTLASRDPGAWHDFTREVLHLGTPRGIDGAEGYALHSAPHLRSLAEQFGVVVPEQHDVATMLMTRREATTVAAREAQAQDRACTRCRVVQPASEFRPRWGGDLGPRRSDCKTCERTRREEYAQAAEQVTARTGKRCYRCGHTLPLDMFAPRTESADGLSSRCTECDAPSEPDTAGPSMGTPAYAALSTPR